MKQTIKFLSVKVSRRPIQHDLLSGEGFAIPGVSLENDRTRTDSLIIDTEKRIQDGAVFVRIIPGDEELLETPSHRAQLFFSLSLFSVS